MSSSSSATETAETATPKRVRTEAEAEAQGKRCLPAAFFVTPIITDSINRFEACMKNDVMDEWATDGEEVKTLRARAAVSSELAVGTEFARRAVFDVAEYVAVAKHGDDEAGTKPTGAATPAIENACAAFAREFETMRRVVVHAAHDDMVALAEALEVDAVPARAPSGSTPFPRARMPGVRFRPE
jgi:hypothetical protein